MYFAEQPRSRNGTLDRKTRRREGSENTHRQQENKTFADSSQRIEGCNAKLRSLHEHENKTNHPYEGYKGQTGHRQKAEDGAESRKAWFRLITEQFPILTVEVVSFNSVYRTSNGCDTLNNFLLVNEVY